MSDQLLQQLLEEVRSLKLEIRDQRELGFSHGVRSWASRIQIGEPEDYDSSSNGGCAWYRWNANTRRCHVIDDEFLTGRITRIWLDDSREYKGKPNIKLMIRVEADCTYELVSSYDNLFSRSFLWGIYQTSLDRFKNPVSIQVKPGWDKEKQKFTGSTWCNLNQGRDYLNRGYPSNEQGNTEEAQKGYWANIRDAAISKFNQINQPSGSIVPQPAPNPPALFTNLDRFYAIAKAIHIPTNQAKSFIKGVFDSNFPGRKTSELMPAEVLKMRSLLLIHWGARQLPEGWGNEVKATYLQSVGMLDEDTSDEDLAQAWLAELPKLISKAS